jgi:hypothetical protein
MQVFGDLDGLPFVRISEFNQICHVNQMDSIRNLSQAFNNNPQGSRLKGQPKTGCRICKNRADWGSPLKGQRSPLDCSAI